MKGLELSEAYYNFYGKIMIHENTENANPFSSNLFDKNVEMIEMICKLIVEELNKQDLSDCHDPFLENHTMGMMQKIKDKQIKSLQITEG